MTVIASHPVVYPPAEMPVLGREAIDILDLVSPPGLEYRRVFSAETVDLGVLRRQKATVQLGAITCHTTHVLDSRTFVSGFVSSGGQVRELGSMAGPLAYIANSDPDGPDGFLAFEWRRERGMIDALPVTPGSQFVTGLPHAERRSGVLYESTAEGVPVKSLLGDLAEAYGYGWLSRDDVLLSLYGIHRAGGLALLALHAEGFEHVHPHKRNLKYSLRTGRAAILDYTLATDVSDGPPKARWASFEMDRRKYVRNWLVCLNDLPAHGKDPLWYLWNELKDSPWPDDAAVAAAQAKLENAVIRLRLQEIGIERPSKRDAQRVIAARDRLLAGAPDIYYRKNG